MNCLQGTTKITSDIINLLDKIDNESYQMPLDVFNGSSLGQHFRHILDFYNCLVRDADRGLVDYASRERNLKIEIDTQAAKTAFLYINQRIKRIDGSRLIEVRADLSTTSDGDRPIVQSSIARELMFAYDHALHHLAMVKIGLQTNFPQICIDEKLGVAPSTLKFQKGRVAPSETGGLS